ncbi:helix-turn-helix domain-containing protein [Rhodobacterales bacterium HKCCE3408]|nr:helix-turn-helix domain-containing protein [Rhodobacterales bacterium HKCCE3408]
MPTVAECAHRSRKTAQFIRDQGESFGIGDAPGVDRRAGVASFWRMFTQWTVLDLFLRGGAIAVLSLCALIFLLGLRPTRKSVSIAAFCLVLCAYLLVSTPAMPISSNPVGPLLILAAGIAPVLGYWASLELFLDDVAFEWWQIALMIGVVIAAWLPPSVPLTEPLRGAAVIALFCHLLLAILMSARDDLVEARRGFRRMFLLAVIAVVIGITAVELAGQAGHLPAWVFALQAAVFLALAAMFLIWAVRLSPTVWLAKPAAAAPSASHAPADTALAAKAQAAMAAGLWREEGLTIGRLATHLDSQEHRVRRAINTVLGFRNFPSFVNGYRIAEAKRLLVDPDTLDRAVLSIAYDVGFASIGPFNRAFRASEGMSPTDYRRAAFTQAAGQKATFS